jgi:hypothetical protein
VAVRSLGAQVCVPEGTGTRVGDGTGVGVALVHGTMEPDGCFDASGLTAAEVGDGDSAALAVVLPQPASARPMSTARR